MVRKGATPKMNAVGKISQKIDLRITHECGGWYNPNNDKCKKCRDKIRCQKLSK